MTDASVWKIVDWLCRESAAKWLDVAGLTNLASALRGLAPITSATRALAAASALTSARDAAAALWAAAARKGPGSDAASAATRQVAEEIMKGVPWAGTTGAETWPGGLAIVAHAMGVAWYAAGAAALVGVMPEDSDAKVRADADMRLAPSRDELKTAAVALQATLDKAA